MIKTDRLLDALVHDVEKHCKWRVKIYKRISSHSSKPHPAIIICCSGYYILVVNHKCVKPLLLRYCVCLNKLQSRPTRQLKQLQQKPFVPSFCTRSGPITYHKLDMLLTWTKNPTQQFPKKTVTAVTLYACHPILVRSVYTCVRDELRTYVGTLLLLSYCLIRGKCNMNSEQRY